MKRNLFLFCCLLISSFSFGQFIPVSLKQDDVYLFLHELQSEKIIEADLSVSPLSRNAIANYLKQAETKSDKLNNRQVEELKQYLKYYIDETNYSTSSWFDLIQKSKRSSFRGDMFYYHDSLFTFAVNPIIGINSSYTNGERNYKRKNGASAYGAYKNWSLWVNLRDNYSQIVTNSKSYLTTETGGAFKGNEFEEINGGIAFSNNFATLAMMKDNMTWGQNRNGSNILSDKAPTFPQIYLKLKPVKWLTINYIHAWLVSNVIDSSRSYHDANIYRTVMYQKYLASNFITITPLKKLSISIGNSIVYSNLGFQPAYLIPVMFYKAVDHSINGMSNYTGQNAQMFGSFSTQLIPHTTIYSSVYLDEISIERMRDKSSHSNFYSIKAGAEVFNFPIKNLSFCVEYTRTNPITYNHFISTTTYVSNFYNLGHYLKDNSEEIYASATYQIKRANFSISYCNAKHGTDYGYTGKDRSGLGMPFIDTVKWSNTSIKLEAKYQFTEHIRAEIGLINSNISDVNKIYTPEYLIGRKNTIFMGLTYGF